MIDSYAHFTAQRQREKHGKAKKCACGNKTYDKHEMCVICRMEIKEKMKKLKGESK